MQKVTVRISKLLLSIKVSSRVIFNMKQISFENKTISEDTFKVRILPFLKYCVINITVWYFISSFLYTDVLKKTYLPYFKVIKIQ